MATKILGNSLFQIFHNTQNIQRKHCFKSIKNKLSNNIEYLNSETIYFKNYEDILGFTKNNKKFKYHIVHDYDIKGRTFPRSPGEIGIWASSYLAYKNFLKTDKEYLILFEDDVVISNNFINILEEYIKELPQNFDIFSFFNPGDMQFIYNKETHDIVNAKYVCKSHQTWSAAGYLITRAGAKKTIEYVEQYGIADTFDWYIFNVNVGSEKHIILDAYSLKPNIYSPVKFFLNTYENSTVVPL